MATQDSNEVAALWSAALAQYHRTTGTDLNAPNTPRVDNVEDLLALIVDKEDRFRKWRNDGGKVDRFRSAVRGSMDPLLLLGGWVDKGVSTVFPPSSNVLSAVTVLVKAANNVSADYDRLLSIFVELRTFLDGLKILKEHIPYTPEILSVIIDILTSILVLIGLTTKEVKHGRVVSFFKDIKGENEEIIAAYNELQAALEREERLFQKQIFVYTKESRDIGFELRGDFAKLAATQDTIGKGVTSSNFKQDQILAELMASKQGNEMKRIREHLNPPPVTEFETLRKELVKNTATWVFEDETYIKWKKGHKAVLWLSGGPGYGKSHLSTSIIDNLLQASVLQFDDRFLVACYYFRANDHRKQMLMPALCAIITQLAERDDVYRAHAAQICDSSASFSMATAASVWADYIVPNFEPTSNKRLFLVFDGIDEAADGEVKELISLLRGSLAEGLRARVLLVGRPDMDATVRRLGADLLETLEVSHLTNDADIVRFIDAKYNKYINITKVRGLREEIVNTLKEKAKGMFLYVDLMYQELEGIKQPKKLRSTLNNMPSGLYNLYDHMMDRIIAGTGSTKRIMQLRELFCLTVYSKEPVSLLIANQIIQHASSDDAFEVKKMLKNLCNSLFQLVETGTLLMNTVLAAATMEDNIVDSGGIDSDTASEEELDEDEFEAADEDRQRGTLIQLRHASLRDYLRDKGDSSNETVLSERDARVYLLLTSLRLICKNAGAPEAAWDHALQNFVDQLDDVNSVQTSDDITKEITELLATIFTSEPLAKFIAFKSGTETYFETPITDALNFGEDKRGKANLQTILKWLSRASELEPSTLTSTASTWVTSTRSQPSTLLMPLTKTCISEWLNSDYSKPGRPPVRLGLIIQSAECTNLLPSKNGSPVPDSQEDDDLDRIFSMFPVDWTPIKRCRLAEAMCEQGSYKESISVWEKALEQANRGTSIEERKFVFSEYAMAVQRYLCWRELKDSAGLILRNLGAYIELEPSNCIPYIARAMLWGSAFDNQERAIQDYMRAIDLKKNSGLIAGRLIEFLDRPEDSQRIIDILENLDANLIGLCIRENAASADCHLILFGAADTVNKREILARIYSQEIERSWDTLQISKKLENGDDQLLRRIASPLPSWSRVRSLVSSRTFFHTSTTLLRCWLAYFHRRDSNRQLEAMRLWTSALLKDSSLWKLTEIYSDSSTDFIVFMLSEFASLLYSMRARSSDRTAQITEDPLRLLELLQRRHEASIKLKSSSVFQSSSKDVNPLLARLYLRCNRIKEAQHLLLDQLTKVVEMLRDDFVWNDSVAFREFAKLLHAVGCTDDAEVALSLMRFRGFNAEVASKAASPETSRDESIVLQFTYSTSCAAGSSCMTSPGTKGDLDGTLLYHCMICNNADYCEPCYHAHIDQGSKPTAYFICDETHEFLHSPTANWDVANGVMTFRTSPGGEGGEVLREENISDWLGGAEKRCRAAIEKLV